MTREEAIQWLEEMKATIELYNSLSKSYTFDKFPQAIDMAIEALSAETVSREEYESMKRANEFNMRMCSEVEHELHDLKQKQAEAVQGWIPCSERLPSNSGNYLITVADFRLGHIGEHAVTTADFYAKEKKWNSVVDVVAWMPLPTPYKGGDTE